LRVRPCAEAAMNNLPKDLFSDTTMSFGDHLEALRSHLWKAMAGVAIGCVVCLFFGTEIVNIIRWPLDEALASTDKKLIDDTGKSPIPIWWAKITGKELPKTEPAPKNPDGTENPEAEVPPITVTGVMAVEIDAGELVAELRRVLPGQIPEIPAAALKPPLTINLKSDQIAKMQQAVLDSKKPVALSPQEPFMIYLKVSGLAGLVLASPWVFYQVWLFISAGLYMHERKYMYAFGTLSLVLFIVGIVFCFRMVLPLALKFLMTYNESVGVKLEPRLSEYLTFASILPLMFGIGFQLPLIMVFLERMNLVSIQVFIEKWRIAVFAISFISMILTPPEPISMMMMMGPMVTLYFMGILLCKWTSNKREVAPVPSV
jgi:sec-independent protein translocase protein TatC